MVVSDVGMVFLELAIDVDRGRNEEFISLGWNGSGAMIPHGHGFDSDLVPYHLHYHILFSISLASSHPGRLLRSRCRQSIVIAVLCSSSFYSVYLGLGCLLLSTIICLVLLVCFNRISNNLGLASMRDWFNLLHFFSPGKDRGGCLYLWPSLNYRIIACFQFLFWLSNNLLSLF